MRKETVTSLFFCVWSLHIGSPPTTTVTMSEDDKVV